MDHTVIKRARLSTVGLNQLFELFGFFIPVDAVKLFFMNAAAAANTFAVESDSEGMIGGVEATCTVLHMSYPISVDPSDRRRCLGISRLNQYELAGLFHA